MGVRDDEARGLGLGLRLGLGGVGLGGVGLGVKVETFIAATSSNTSLLVILDAEGATATPALLFPTRPNVSSTTTII